MADAWEPVFAAAPSLRRHHALLVEEELTPSLMRSMSDLRAALAELDFGADDAEAMVQALTAPPAPSPSPAPPPPPQSPRPLPTSTEALLSPPRGWPSSASKANKFVTKELRGTKMRAVGTLTDEHAALLTGLTLRAGDARGNAIRIRDRAGWPILSGFALYERDRATGDSEDATSTSDAPSYVGLPHYWNATPRGLWLDGTPRPADHINLVLVESAHAPPPPPPPYESQSTNPLVIVAVEGLCNRLRATLSYRLVAHEQGRPLHVIWRKDDYCPGHFLDVFLPIPGVKFFKSPPNGASLASLHAATDTHPSVKATPNEAYSYAPLTPSDALRQAIAQQLATCGQSFAAMHVRRTDLFTAVPASQHTQDAEFEAWADSLVPRVNERRAPRHKDGVCIFVATDNAETQQRFLSTYGDAAKVHKRIKPSGALRQTALAEAVVDLFVCAAASLGFMGSHYSSYSDAIRFLRAAHGKPDAVKAIGAAREAARIKEAAATKYNGREGSVTASRQVVDEGEEELIAVPPSSVDSAGRAHERAQAQAQAAARAAAAYDPYGRGGSGEAQQREEEAAAAAAGRQAAEERTARAAATAAAEAAAIAGSRPSTDDAARRIGKPSPSAGTVDVEAMD